MKTDAIIVDVDGTIAIKGDRHIYDGSLVHLDTPNEPIVKVVDSLYVYGFDVVFTTGRWEQFRKQTEDWLEANMDVYYSDLFMRADGDYRADSIVKEEIYHDKIEPVYNVLLVLDDRDSVVKMWRSLGLTCLQVAEGNF